MGRREKQGELGAPWAFSFGSWWYPYEPREPQGRMWARGRGLSRVTGFKHRSIEHEACEPPVGHSSREMSGQVDRAFDHRGEEQH